jgi:hypothetical protein
MTAARHNSYRRYPMQIDRKACRETISIFMKSWTSRQQISTEFVAALVRKLATTIQRKNMHVWQARSRVTQIQISRATDFSVAESMRTFVTRKAGLSD